MSIQSRSKPGQHVDLDDWVVISVEVTRRIIICVSRTLYTIVRSSLHNVRVCVRSRSRNEVVECP